MVVTMHSPVPVILITGFLGSGKTTFINQVLKDHPGKKISLILNEFGDIKLESQFIEVKGVGMVSELSGGCLCCVANVDLPRVIRYTLEHAPATEYLIIEASGLSDPDPVRATLNSSQLADLIRLDTVVAIVDADNFSSTATAHPLILSQIADADLALISKASSHSPASLAELVARVGNIGLGTRTLVWDSSLNTSLIFDPPLNPHNKVDHASHHSHIDYEQYWYTSEKVHDPNKIIEVLRALPTNILRVKGYVDRENQRYLVQKVGNHVDVREGQIDQSVPPTAILILGTGLDNSLLNTQFSSCIIN